MPSIKFTDNELEFLRNHYEQELADAEMYIADIRKIISKLGKAEAENQQEAPKKKRGRPAKALTVVKEVQPTETTEKKKRGRKPGSKNAKAAKKKAAKKAAAEKKTVVTRKSLVAKNTDYVPKTVVKKIKETEAVPVTVPAETPEQ